MGFDANIQATQYLEAGLGFCRQYQVAMIGRHTGTRNLERVDFNFGIPIWGSSRLFQTPLLEVERTEADEVVCRKWTGDISQFESNPEPLSLDDDNRRALEAGVFVHFITVGIGAGLDIGETLDFVAGIFGVDLEKDDEQKAWASTPALREITRPRNLMTRLPDNYEELKQKKEARKAAEGKDEVAPDQDGLPPASGLFQPDQAPADAPKDR